MRGTEAEEVVAEEEGEVEEGITPIPCPGRQPNTTLATSRMAATILWATPPLTGELAGTTGDHRGRTTLPPTTTSCPASASTRGRCSECTSTTISDRAAVHARLD